jgi:hypothetical protein
MRRDSRLVRMSTLAFMLASLIASCVGSSGCSSTHRAVCLPERLTVDRVTVQAGSAIRLASKGFHDRSCRYPAGESYQLWLAAVGRQRKRLTHVSVARDGSFETTVTIPSDTSPGEAFIVASGSAFDHCQDTAGGPACPWYSTPAVLITSPT